MFFLCIIIILSILLFLALNFFVHEQTQLLFLSWDNKFYYMVIYM